MQFAVCHSANGMKVRAKSRMTPEHQCTIETKSLRSTDSSPTLYCSASLTPCPADPVRQFKLTLPDIPAAIGSSGKTNFPVLLQSNPWLSASRRLGHRSAACLYPSLPIFDRYCESRPIPSP